MFKKSGIETKTISRSKQMEIVITEEQVIALLYDRLLSKRVGKVVNHAIVRRPEGGYTVTATLDVPPKIKVTESKVQE